MWMQDRLAHDATLLKVPKYKKATSRKALAYKGSMDWNKLDVKVRNVDCRDKFKDIQKTALKLLVDRAGLGNGVIRLKKI